MSEIDDTPGSRVPTEWLDESLSGAAVIRRQRRLMIASRLMQASAHNLLSDMVRGESVRLLATARRYSRAALLLADELIAQNDEFEITPPTTHSLSVTVENPLVTYSDRLEHIPMAAAERDYLLWLSTHEPVYVTVRPPGLSDAAKAAVERVVLKRGLIHFDEKHRVRLTDEGHAAVEKLRGAPQTRPPSEFTPPADDNLLPATRVA